MTSRGQAATDYLLALSIIVVLIAAVVLPVLSEAESTAAMTAARTASTAFAASNGTIVVTSIDYASIPGNVTISPRVYYLGSRLSSVPLLKRAIIGSIAATISPAANTTGQSCVRGVYNSYCVDV